MTRLFFVLFIATLILGCNSKESSAGLTYVSSGGPGNGFRIQGLQNYTYALRYLNSYNLVGTVKTCTGASVDLSGSDFQGAVWTSGTACKIEIRDPSNVLVEIVKFSTGPTAGSVYSHTLPTVSRPLNQQTYLQTDTISLVVNAPSGATVTATVAGSAVTMTYTSGTWQGNKAAVGLSGPTAVSVNVNGANTSKTVYVYNSSDTGKRNAFELATWLRTSWITDSWGGQLIKERYDVATDSWDWLDAMGGGIWLRPDCNHETMVFFGRMYQLTGETVFLTAARSIFAEIAHIQMPDKRFWFYYTSTGGNPSNLIYTNDNAEVVIFCMEMADIDTVNASQYQARALEVAEALRTLHQNSSTGGFRINNANSINSTPPHFTAHGLAALCRVYPLLSGTTKATYRTAIERGFTFLHGQIQASGRIKCNLEYDGINEGIRPPSSDHFIALRAFAFAEKYVTDSANISQWHADRQTLLSFVPTITHSSGAMVNGTGVHWSDNNSPNLTDHVYTNYFALVSLRLSADLDNSTVYKSWRDNLLAFLKANMHYSDIPEMNGVLRGSYNLSTQSWDTIQETPTFASDPELGGNIIYSGWTSAPIGLEMTLTDTVNSVASPVSSKATARASFK